MIEQFRAAMASSRIDYDGEIYPDGKLHRFKARGDKEKNSWYLLHSGPPIAAGAFGCWKRHLSERWSQRDVDLSPAEQAYARERWAEAERERKLTEAESQSKARRIAQWIIARATPCTSHPYLERKGVKVIEGLRIYKGAIALPLRDEFGVLQSLQFISEDGTKKFLSSGKCAGASFSIGESKSGPLVITEGLATGLSVHGATGYTVICAMNAGNLRAVTKGARSRFPDREIIVAADDDAFTEGNPGVAKAKEAALEVSARISTPQFPEPRNRATDFNDLHAVAGLAEVKKQIEGARVAQPPEVTTMTATNGAPKTPSGMIILPNDHKPITESAAEIFKVIAPTHSIFVRGRTAMELAKDRDGTHLDILTPERFRSLLERYGTLGAWKLDSVGNRVLRQKICPEESAKALLATNEAQEILPRVNAIVRAPVLSKRDGGTILGKGYHSDNGGVLVTGGGTPPEVGVEEAGAALCSLLTEFSFQSSGDYARALAALLTPALKLGGFINDPIPVDVAEADVSQSGKTYRQKVVRAIYRELDTAYAIASKTGGVGSLDESLSAALLSGKTFIVFDNFRGRMDSQWLEMVMTWGAPVACRVPHKGEVMVDPSMVTFQLTSNGVETTRDLANRSSIVRIKKRVGYQYKDYPEGKLLDHVQARQPYYLGCVFAVIREWIRLGCAQTNETRHDFRQWAGTLDWICQNIIGTAALLDGHQQAQERVSNPAMSFLRKIALAASTTSLLGNELSASQIYDICQEEGIDIPGLKHPNEDAGRKIIGNLMAKCFGGEQEVTIDHLKVRRGEVQEYNTNRAGYVSVKKYVVENAQKEPESLHPLHPLH